MSSLDKFNSVLEALKNTNPRTITGNGLISGSSGNDKIEGSDDIDGIYGLGGDDLIYSKDGADIVHGGEGNDIIFGGDGDIDGDLFGGESRGSAEEELYGEDGDDWIFGEGGNDLLVGGKTSGDFKFSDNDDDHLYGGDGYDRLVGGYGSDFLVGGADDDTLTGSSEKRGHHAYDGVDILWGDEEGGNGSTGADRFVLGQDGVVYYDDGVDVSNGTLQYALIKDFNPNAGDTIQLARLQTQPIGSSPSYWVVSPSSVYTVYSGSGVAIVFSDGVSGHNPELIAIIENQSSLNLQDESYIIYS
jgi:Ca2+-binding RTX toxin-like protein